MRGGSVMGFATAAPVISAAGSAGSLLEGAASARFILDQPSPLTYATGSRQWW